MGLYTLTSQKTYLGKTAGGHLKNAKIVRMEAGNYEVWIPQLQAIAILTVSGEMVVEDSAGKKVCLFLSRTARKKLSRFENRIEALYAKDNNL